MSQPLLRVPLGPLAPGLVALPPDTAHYLTRVHRLRPGDRFLAFDPERAQEAEATLASADRGGAAASFEAVRAASLVPLRRVTLIQCVGKGDKLDAVVRDATELGATRVIPALSARCVARPAADRAVRWRRIAVEAARQCGRGDAPVIEAPAPLAGAIERVRAASGACLDPRGDTPLGRWLRGAASDAGVERELAFVVGPEGGLSDDEVAACAGAGFARVRLGRLTLRTETVCAAVLGALVALADS
jgi:16S rRNA (uracil1498-N3)-methyltransferase